MFLKRYVPLLIVIGVGLLTLFGHFINHPGIQNFVDNDSTQWFDIIASFAIFLGSLNMLKLQVIKIFRKQKNWQYSILAVFGFAFAIFAGFFYRGAYYINVLEIEKDQLEQVSEYLAGELNAKEETINTILVQAKRKEAGMIDKLYVTGCLSERYKPDLERDIPNVDQYFGTTDLPKLLKVLGADYKHELLGERLTTTPKHYAYLKIAEGCDRPCSFCAIPLMRGKHKSTPIEQLVIEAKNLAKNGVKELILIAQDLTFYGLDIYKKRRLADLLTNLSKIEGV